MNCKFCNGELPEDVTLCPLCGKENAEEVIEETVLAVVEEPVADGAEETAEAAEEAAEAVVEATVEETAEAAEEAPAEPAKKKTKAWKIVLAVVAVIALVAVLAGAVMHGMGVFDKQAQASYSVEQKEAIKARDVVVATVGDVELTNSELQIYFWQAVDEFYNYYGYYMDMETLGLDLEKPLDEQYYNEEEGITWQKYFLDAALSTWSRYAALKMDGQEAGFTLDAEVTAYIETIPEQLESMAVSYGFESAEDMLNQDMNYASDMDGYLAFMHTNLYSNQYMETFEESLIPTAEEIEEYYAANTEYLNTQGIEKDGSIVVDVRHILLCPDGGTEDDAGNVTYTEAEWEACRVEAQALYDQWLADGTEDGFAALAAEHTEDPGSVESGGMYTDVYEGQMVPEFNDWCFDASRKYGDSGLVKTDYGYHLMYFVTSREVWFESVKNTIINERGLELVDNAVAKWPMEADYDKMVIGESTAEEASAETAE